VRLGTRRFLDVRVDDGIEVEALLLHRSHAGVQLPDELRSLARFRVSYGEASP